MEEKDRLLKELEQVREGSEGPEAPPKAPPKLIVQVVPAIGPSGSRVSTSAAEIRLLKGFERLGRRWKRLEMALSRCFFVG